MTTFLLRNCSDAASTIKRRHKLGYLYHEAAPNREKQKAVIQCMLAGVPLPAVYAVADATGALMFIHNEYIMRAIFDFMDGKFTVDDMTFQQSGGRAMNRIEDAWVSLFALDYRDRELAPLLVSTILV